MVISGINHGYNISTDVLYSGTVAAAREALINGMKAIAINASKDENGKFAFTESSVFVRDNLSFFMNLVDESTIISINVPPRPNGKSDRLILRTLTTMMRSRRRRARRFASSIFLGHFGTSVILKLKVGQVQRSGAPPRKVTSKRSRTGISV